MMNKNINWFPGHMVKSLRGMKKIFLRDRIGCVLEIRDARIPLTSVNWKLEQLLLQQQQQNDGVTAVIKDSFGAQKGSKFAVGERFIIYNKMDLVVKSREGDSTVKERLLHLHLHRHQKERIIFSQLDGRGRFGSVEVLEKCLDYWLQLHGPYMHKTPSVQYPDLNIMVIGLPNTGKSSLINGMKLKGGGGGGGSEAKKIVAAAKVGKNPGETTSLSQRLKILDTTDLYNLRRRNSDGGGGVGGGGELTFIQKRLVARGIRLKVYVVDTPGILPPFIENQEDALKMAVCNCLPVSENGQKGADVEAVAEYLYQWIRKWDIESELRQVLGMSSTTAADFKDFILDFAVCNSLVFKHNGQANILGACSRLLRYWRSGSVLDRFRQQHEKFGHLLKNVPRFSVFDQELFDDAELEQWYKQKYSSSSRSSSKSEGEGEVVKVGELNVPVSLMENSKDRKRRVKQTRK